MLEKICHIGPGFAVQGGISSVLVSYKKLYDLPDENFMESYNGSFVRSLPGLFRLCAKILFAPSKKFDFYQIHTSKHPSCLAVFFISKVIFLLKQI